MTVKEIYRIALIDLELSEKQFFSLTPAQTVLIQMRIREKNEVLWTHTRRIVCEVHNSSMGRKRALKPEQVIQLRTDNIKEYIWNQEDADKALKAWKIKLN